MKYLTKYGLIPLIIFYCTILIIIMTSCEKQHCNCDGVKKYEVHNKQQAQSCNDLNYSSLNNEYCVVLDGKGTF